MGEVGGHVEVRFDAGGCRVQGWEEFLDALLVGVASRVHCHARRGGNTADGQEGVRAFADKRSPSFEGG